MITQVTHTETVTDNAETMIDVASQNQVHVQSVRLQMQIFDCEYKLRAFIISECF